MTTERTESPQDVLIVSGWRARRPAGQPGPDHLLVELLRAAGGVVHQFTGRQVLEMTGRPRPN